MNSSRCRGSSGRTRWKTACCADARSFINPIPHVSFVHGADRVEYLRAPQGGAGLQPAVRGHRIHRRPRRVRPPAAADGRQARLLRPGRPELDPGRHRHRLRLAVQAADRLRRAQRHRRRCSATRSATCDSESDGTWTVKVRNRRTGDTRKINARFVFVGAGGDALPLLQKSGINGGEGLRRVPGRRKVPAHVEPGADRGAPGQGVRLPAARRAADVGAAPGRPDHQR